MTLPRGGPNATWLDRAYEWEGVEWLDDPDVPQSVKDAGIAGLHRFNVISGGYFCHTLSALRALPPSPRPSILELGAGSGALCARIARKLPRGRVIASDLSADYVRKMRADLELRDLRVEVMQLDATCIALPDQSVDLAVFVQGLHHLDPVNVVKLLEEGTRVARRLLVIDAWRHPALLAVTPLIWLVGNYPAFRDGVVSLRRMYSLKAFRVMAARACVPLKVAAGFAAPAHLRAVVERA